MTRRKKLLLVFVFLAAVIAVAVSQFSPHARIEKRIVHEMEARGLSRVEVKLASVDNTHLAFARIAFRQGKIDVTAEEVTISASSLPYAELLQGNMENLAGDWSVKSLVVTDAPYPLPPLSGAGKWQFKNHAPQVDGMLASADKTHHTTFTIDAQEMRLQQTRLPWQGARLSAAEIRIPFDRKTPIRIPLRVERMPLATLLAMATGGKASGTGEVSGSVPVIIARDGTVTLGTGRLAAEEDGVIKLSPDALPGDAPQMEIARTALSNFHYNVVSLTTATGKDGRPIIHLQLEGNNPEAFNGRPVKLTINLSGDVLQALQSTLQMMNDPQKWIERENK